MKGKKVNASVRLLVTLPTILKTFTTIPISFNRLHFLTYTFVLVVFLVVHSGRSFLFSTISSVCSNEAEVTELGSCSLCFARLIIPELRETLFKLASS